MALWNSIYEPHAVKLHDKLASYHPDLICASPLLSSLPPPPHSTDAESAQRLHVCAPRAFTHILFPIVICLFFIVYVASASLDGAGGSRTSSPFQRSLSSPTAPCCRLSPERTNKATSAARWGPSWASLVCAPKAALGRNSRVMYLVYSRRVRRKV